VRSLTRDPEDLNLPPLALERGVGASEMLVV
jgi:hypothetical protein